MIIDFILLVTVDYKWCAYFLHRHMYKNTCMQTEHVGTKELNHLSYICLSHSPKSNISFLWRCNGDRAKLFEAKVHSVFEQREKDF